MEDIEIIELYTNKNQEGITQTANKYGKLLYKIAFGVLTNHEDSEETVNDSYQGLWEIIPPKKPDNLRAFVCRITRNLAITRFRKVHAQKREGVILELSEIIPDTKSLEQSIDLKELTTSIESFLLNIPKEDRVLFVKRYFFNISIKDLAVETKIAENKITSKLFRIRKKLKTQLLQEGYEI